MPHEALQLRSDGMFADLYARESPAAAQPGLTSRVSGAQAQRRILRLLFALAGGGLSVTATGPALNLDASRALCLLRSSVRSL